MALQLHGSYLKKKKITKVTFRKVLLLTSSPKIATLGNCLCKEATMHLWADLSASVWRSFLPWNQNKLRFRAKVIGLQSETLKHKKFYKYIYMYSLYCYIDESYNFSNANRKIYVSVNLFKFSWSNFSIMNHKTNTLLLNI